MARRAEQLDKIESLRERLAAAGEDERVKSAAARAARELRDQLIHEADENFMRPADIGRDVGLSPSRVFRILAGV